MVHALLETRRVLRAGGALIDLRPTARNRWVELELANRRVPIGEIDSSASAGEKVLADEMLQVALDEGFFRAEHHAHFEYVTDIDNLDDLREFASQMRRSVMPESIFHNVEELTASQPTDYLIRIRREMLIARYRRD